MDPHAQRAFTVGAAVQLAVMLGVAVAFTGDRFETLLSLSGAVGGSLTAALLVRFPPARSWEDGAFYGCGAAAVATVAYFGVESSVTTLWIWYTQGTFAPVEMFLVRYLFGVWLVVISVLLGVVGGLFGFRIASAFARRTAP